MWQVNMAKVWGHAPFVDPTPENVVSLDLDFIDSWSLHVG